MRTSTILHLILGFLLHITLGNTSDPCFKGNLQPINISQVNGLWNIRALASNQPPAGLNSLNKLHYIYAKISLTKKEGLLTEFFNPMEQIYWNRPVYLQRVDDEKETLTYMKDNYDSSLFTFYQFIHPDVLLVNHQFNDIKKAALYVRSSSHAESKLDDFKEWSKCNELTFFKELNNTVDYAQKCYGLFEDKKLLHLEEKEEDVTSWHLVAKSSTSMDQHYNVRILYTARLEINRKEHTFKEIITAPNDKVVFEGKLEEPTVEDGNIGLTFKTEDSLLLLGLQTKTGRTLYLASKTPTVRQSVIEKFKAQALCFETKYNYFIPGSIEEDDGPEACAHHLEKWEPINFRESVGKWVLTVSAHKNTEMVLQEILSPYGSTVITLIDDKVHLSHISVSQGAILTMKNIEVEESTGHIIYKDTPETRTAIHSVSPNCNILTPEGERIFFICRANHFPPVGDISQFVKYATCRNFYKILIRQPATFLCSEMPTEVHTLDVEKIAGTWKLAAVASNIPDGDVNFPNEMHFIVTNGEVTITDGEWKSTTKMVGNNRLHYTKGHEHVMEIRFHEPLGDSLLTWVGNPEKHISFLVLFSKSERAAPDEHVRFKHFAACLSLPVVFLKE